MTVRHDPDAHAFVADVDGGRAELAYEEPSGDLLDLTHTFVPEAARGQDVGGQLVRAALDHARRSGRKVVATCPFVQKFVARNPEYGDLVVKA